MMKTLACFNTMPLLACLAFASSATAQQWDLYETAPTEVPDPAAKIAAQISSDCRDLINADRYAESLAAAQALVGTRYASYVRLERLFALIGLGRLDEARRIFADEVPGLGTTDLDDRSGGGLPPLRGIEGYLEAKAGRCPEPLWRFLTEEFYGDPAFSKLKAVTQVFGSGTRMIPTEPSPRSLEFLCIFEVAPWLGPRGRESLYRRAVELYPLNAMARDRLALSMGDRAGCLVEPDGTVATPSALPRVTEEDKAAYRAYYASLRVQILDEAVAREILAHYRIALQNAPDVPSLRKELKDRVWMWEYNLGMHR